MWSRCSPRAGARFDGRCACAARVRAMSTTVVTGGAGYIGAVLSARLLEAGHDVTVLDALVHGQTAQAEALRERGARILAGDLRDPALRAEALEGAAAVVHLAAIVGDPACAREPPP